MEIKDELLKERSLKQSENICRVVLSNNDKFGQLMQCFCSNEYRLAQRAAAVVRLSVLKNPKAIEPYFKELIDRLLRKDVHNAVIRNTVRVLQQVEIPEQFHGHVITSCFSFIQDPATPVAIKAFSLTTLYNLSKFYPDIERELKLVIEDRFELETAAFQSRARKILANLKTI